MEDDLKKKNFFLSQLEKRPKTKMKDDLKKMKNGRRPKKMEDNLNKKS